MQRIISARQIQKLAKDGSPIFLAIARQTIKTPQKRGKKGNKDLPTVWQGLQLPMIWQKEKSGN